MAQPDKLLGPLMVNGELFPKVTQRLPKACYYLFLILHPFDILKTFITLKLLYFFLVQKKCLDQGFAHSLRFYLICIKIDTVFSNIFY